MSATVTKGVTFTSGQQNIAVATFNPVLTSATITNIDRDNVKLTDATAATYAAVAPTNPQPSEVWQDNVNNQPMAYISSAWAPGVAFCQAVTLDAASGTVAAGDVLMPSTTGGAAALTMFKASTSTKYAWCAVAVVAMAPGASGMAVFHGPAKIKSTGTINVGEAVIPSSTDATVQSAAAAGLGYGPTVLGTAFQAASGGFVWVNFRR